MKQIAILGSTGSIGTQTLDVVRQYPSEFSVYALSAHRNVELLIQQALEFNPAVVCIADESLYPPLRDALSDLLAANKGGFDFLGVLTGVEGEGAREWLQKNKADYILDSILNMCE